VGQLYFTSFTYSSLTLFPLSAGLLPDSALLHPGYGTFAHPILLIIQDLPPFYNYVASYVAARLGRLLFQSDRPELLQSVDEYYASLQQDAAH